MLKFVDICSQLIEGAERSSKEISRDQRGGFGTPRGV
jgi:hypothetical protein